MGTTQTTLASSVIQQTPERQGRARKEEQVIMQILVLCLAVSAHAVPQGINFGESALTTKKPAVGQRLGLLANSLGLDPTASQNQGTSSAFTDGTGGQASGRVPQGGEFGGQQCCCVPAHEQCGDPLGREDLVGGGFIDPRFKDPKKRKNVISTRIVNRPQASTNTNALNNQRRGVGDRFTLSPSEICAGAEVGKDACTGDGGSPLVCQAKSGRWTVMGLVTWGVGCASDVPGVYARI